MKVGIFLGRFQPVHKGHLEIIETALSENDYVLVLIGSSDKQYEVRNPFPAHLRSRLLRNSLKDAKIDNFGLVKIHELRDLTDESDNSKAWGNYLIKSITDIIGTDIFNSTIYYSDDPKIMESWFDENTPIKRKYLDRSTIVTGVSATKVRKALLEDNLEYLKDNVTKSVLDSKYVLKNFLESSNNE